VTVLLRIFVFSLVAALGSAALAGAPEPAASVPLIELKACAAMGTPAERLACFEQLAGRVPAVAHEPSVPAQSAPARSAPAPSAPATSASAPSPSPAPPKESFGLYSAEHPAAPKPAAEFTGKVVGLGVSANGHPTVEIEGGQLWELDRADPLLATGDSVTITRASLGSFLMTTPSGRTNRLHRLR
jgi:hypothetical protein